MERRNGLRRGIVLTLLLILAPGCLASEWDGAITTSLSRATTWLAGVHAAPFGAGVPGFRLSVIEVETWHRLWCLEADPAKRSRFQAEVVVRLEEFLDPSLLRALLRQPDAESALTELAVLAARCRTHGLDPDPIREALTDQQDVLASEIEHAPPSIQALYARYLPDAGISPPIPLERARSEGIIARRPRETVLTLADVYYLTHEIYALTDYALEPLGGLSGPERAYLLRILPFYTVFYGALDHLDVTAELITCMNAAGMRDTYAYRDGIRLVLEMQNPDGSFGRPDPRRLGRRVSRSDHLHPTLNCVTALAMERKDRRAEGG